MYLVKKYGDKIAIISEYDSGFGAKILVNDPDNIDNMGFDEWLEVTELTGCHHEIPKLKNGNDDYITFCENVQNCQTCGNIYSIVHSHYDIDNETYTLSQVWGKLKKAKSSEKEDDGIFWETGIYGITRAILDILKTKEVKRLMKMTPEEAQRENIASPVIHGYGEKIFLNNASKDYVYEKYEYGGKTYDLPEFFKRVIEAYTKNYRNYRIQRHDDFAKAIYLYFTSKEDNQSPTKQN